MLFWYVEKIKTKTKDMNNKELYTKIFNEVKSYNYSDILTDPLYSGPLKFVTENIDTIQIIIDVGSGRGHFIGLVKEHHPNIKIISADLDKFSNIDVEFIPVDLTENVSDLNTTKADILTCTGVLEHIKKESLDEVMSVFHRIAPLATFTIANHSDTFFGVDVHVTNEPIDWWKELISKYYDIMYSEEFYPNKILFQFNLKLKHFI